MNRGPTSVAGRKFSSVSFYCGDPEALSFLFLPPDKVGACPHAH